MHVNGLARRLVLTQRRKAPRKWPIQAGGGEGGRRGLFTSYVHEPNFRIHFCRSNGKYCTSIGQVLVKEAGQNQLHLPELDKITGVLYLSVPPLNSLSALQVAIRSLRMMHRFHYYHRHHQKQQQFYLPSNLRSSI